MVPNERWVGGGQFRMSLILMPEVKDLKKLAMVMRIDRVSMMCSGKGQMEKTEACEG